MATPLSAFATRLKSKTPTADTGAWGVRAHRALDSPFLIHSADKSIPKPFFEVNPQIWLQARVYGGPQYSDWGLSWALERKLGKSVHTEFVPLQRFTWAEEYHQKYWRTLEPGRVRELQLVYSCPGNFDNATAVARLTGYADGNGSREQLAREIAQLRLSARGQNLLKHLLRP